MWVEGKRKNIQVLTIIDVFSRINLGQYIAFKIKSSDVITLFKEVIEIFNLPNHFTVRCDNGSQFIATEVQNYLISKGVKQEFTKPSTPQQNAHIESYHSILERAVCQRIEFIDGEDAKNKMGNFRDFYNFERIHSGVQYTSPYKYLLRNKAEFKTSASFSKSFWLLTQMYEDFRNSPVFCG